MNYAGINKEFEVKIVMRKEYSSSISTPSPQHTQPYNIVQADK